jgi:hypothetical protein
VFLMFQAPLFLSCLLLRLGFQSYLQLLVLGSFSLDLRPTLRSESSQFLLVSLGPGFLSSGYRISLCSSIDVETSGSGA